MLQPELMHGAYAVMVIAGSVAIAVNVLCVLPVVRRRRATDGNDEAQLGRQSRRIYAAFAVGLPFGVAALVAGISLVGSD